MSEPDSGQEPAAGDAAGWEIVGWSPQRPFSGALLLSQSDGTQVRVDLEPMFVRDLMLALTDVHAAQRHTFGLPADHGQVEQPAAGDSAAGGSSSGQSAHQPWWRRHKGLAFLLAVLAVVLGYEVIAGAIRIG